MKFWGVFRFELGYQVRRPWPWLIFAALLVTSYLMAGDTSLADAMYEDFFANSAFAISKTTVVGGLVWLLAGAVVAGEAAARDVATRMHPLVYTAPVNTAEYLGGRFLAALVLNAVLLLAVQVGGFLAVNAPGVDPRVIGPFRLAAYLTNYAYIALPNAFVATAIQFWLAARTGRVMASYAGSLLLVFMGFFVASIVRFSVSQDLGMLLDPIGINFIIEELAHEWTPIERNTRLIGLEGGVLSNRLVWLGVAILVLAITYLRFRFEHRIERSWRRGKTQSDNANAPRSGDISVTAPTIVPRAARTFGAAHQARQTLAIARVSFRAMAKSWAGLGLLVIIPLLTVAVVISQMSAVDTPMVPTTARVISELTAPLSSELSRWVIIPLIIVFFAGELLWRERDAGMSEITDAMPGSEWAPFLGKLLGLGLVLVAYMLTLMAAAMVAQVAMGYYNFEIGLYLKILFGLQLPEYLLFAVFALTVHVWTNQKYVGHLVAVLGYAFIAVLAGTLGVEHNLLVYGAGPGWSYTQMRGFGPSIGPWLWFKLYWAAWAVLLAVGARLLWTRGRENGVGVRLKSARRRFSGATASVAAAAMALVLGLGGFVFYNTNILNDYQSTSAVKARRAEYEHRYGRYASSPQPELAGTTLRVELYPARRAAKIRGSYRLVNGTAVPIDSIHVATALGRVETRSITFDRAAKVVLSDETLGYRIYALEKPLAPGDTLRLDFDVNVERRGFSNRGVDPSVDASGSAFTNAAWFPAVGYQRQRELITAGDRRVYGLAPRPVIASLYEADGREPAARGGGIAFEAVVGTDEDQVAVAPGALRRTWTEGGRRYFDYATSAPIGGEWSFYSARYAVHEAQWRNIAIRFFHDPRHVAHLDRMTRSVRASLDYYTAQFGAYPYTHLTVVEVPGAPGIGLHAEPSIISHGEGVAFWNPKDEATSLDLPFAVMAHEMGHEWGLPYALVEGAPFLSEGLAWYSAMQALKASRGDEQLRRLLSFMRRPYPFRPIHRGQPLIRALDPYMSYRKGPFAMYALSEYVGADRVNAALRRQIEKHDLPTAPLATTLDLYRELQAATPDSLRYLLHDLFEVNASWILRTKRATAVETAPGVWQVTLDVQARKVVNDSAGVETVVPMDEWLPIGVFAAAEQGHDELSVPLYLQMHRVRSGDQTITVTVTRKPALAGIDPHHLLDWEEKDDDDNIESVKIESRNTSATKGVSK